MSSVAPSLALAALAPALPVSTVVSGAAIGSSRTPPSSRGGMAPAPRYPIGASDWFAPKRGGRDVECGRATYPGDAHLLGR